MDRREFLKKAGVGSAALAGFSALSGAASAHNAGPRFWLICLSEGATVDGVAHRLIMNGKGHFHGQSQVSGGGNFLHFDNASPVPKTVLSSGRWKVTAPRGANVIGTWGTYAAGVVDMEIELRPLQGVLLPSLPSEVPATLRFVCNIGFAGLVNPGLREGFYLTIPGPPPQTFEPLAPNVGITEIVVG